MITPRIRKLMDNVVPSYYIELPTATAQIYWTENRGMYGYQAVLVLFFDDGRDPYTYKTSGCGYCKISEATNQIWDQVKGMPNGQSRHDRMTYKYHVGGNYYKVPAEEMEAFK